MPAGTDRSAELRAGEATAFFMVSLYFILLAFFVVLTAISNVEAAKSEQVLESVKRAFGTGPSSFEAAFRAGDEDAGYAEVTDRLREIEFLFETVIELAEIKRIERGRLMQVTVPTAWMFADGDTVLPEARALLGRIGRALRTPPAGFRYDLQFIGREVDDDASGRAPIAVRRAGSVARALIRAGAPAESVSVGLETGDPSGVRFVFRFAERRHDRLAPRGGAG